MIDLTVAVKLDSGVKRLRGEPEESFTHTVKPRLTAISLSRPLYSGPKTKLSETFSYLKNLCNTATQVIRVKTAGFCGSFATGFMGFHSTLGSHCQGNRVIIDDAALVMR